MPQDGAIPQDRKIGLMIEKAIEFYVDLIRNPKYGDEENGGLEGVASMLSTYVKLSEKRESTEDQIERFKKSLHKNIWARIRSGYKTIHMESDWFPEGILAEAYFELRIMPNFPSQHTVTIDLVKMEVREGYFGQDPKIIFK